MASQIMKYNKNILKEYLLEVDDEVDFTGVSVTTLRKKVQSSPEYLENAESVILRLQTLKETA